jgi:hypothetical protein
MARLATARPSQSSQTRSFAFTSAIMALTCYVGLLKAKSARSRKVRKTCLSYLCRLCATRDSSAEAKRGDKAALAERRASNGAASSSESSSSQVFRLATAIQSVPSPWAEEQGVPYHESLPESFHKAPSPQELNRQRSHRGTIDTAPSCIPSDINLPEQVSPYLRMSHMSPVSTLVLLLRSFHALQAMSAGVWVQLKGVCSLLLMACQKIANEPMLCPC